MTVGHYGFRKFITLMFYSESMLKLHEESECRKNHKECDLSEMMWDNGTIDGMKSILSNEDLSGGSFIHIN